LGYAVHTPKRENWLLVIASQKEFTSIATVLTIVPGAKKQGSVSVFAIDLRKGHELCEFTDKRDQY